MREVNAPSLTGGLTGALTDGPTGPPTMGPVIVLTGPTGTGKTDWAVRLARRLPLEIGGARRRKSAGNGQERA